MKKNIAFLELGHVFSNQIKFPYSTACVWDYCRQFKIIKDNYNFNLHNWLHVLDDDFSVDVAVEQLKNIDILGVSYFVWNVKISDEICEKVKSINPNCIIVYGGLGMPKWNKCESFLKERPWVDYIVHNEGEIVFKNLLESFLNNDSLNVRGTTNRFFANPLEDRIKDIDSNPSPYLSGLFDELLAIKKHNYDYEALVEPTRGCPYTCTFCEIGDRFYTPNKKHSNEKIFRELDWISKNKINYLHIVDNNFGMYKTHDEISDHLIKLKNETKFPNALNITWAKNKKEHLFEIAKKLNDHDLCKGVTIALQSLNQDTLMAVNRSNLDKKNLNFIIKKLKKMRIPAYVELILGLPEESLNSFKNGIYELLDDYEYHNYIGIYPMTSLPNTPFGDEQYLNKYNIVKISTSPAFFHHQYSIDRLLKDENEMVVSNCKMSFDDYIDATIWKWFMISTHFLGWTRIISIEMKNNFSISFRTFYDNFFEYIRKSKNILYDEMNITRKMVRDVFRKRGPWGRQLKEVSNIYWEYEEATSMVIGRNKNEFYSEVETYINEYYNIADTNIKKLIQIQYNKMKDPHLHYNGDYEKWAKECLWWGRRNEKFFVGDTYEIL